MNKFMTNIKSSALWSIMALCALASCNSTDKKIRETNKEINAVENKIADLETQCIILASDSLRKNNNIKELNTDSLQQVNDSLYNNAVAEYHKRLERENPLNKFFSKSQIKQIQAVLKDAIKTRRIPKMLEEDYNAARRIIANKGSIYDFHCKIHPAVFLEYPDFVNELGLEINTNNGDILYHILSLQYKVDEAMAKRDIGNAETYANQTDQRILDAYSAEYSAVQKQYEQIMNDPTKKKELARLDKRLKTIPKNYGIERAASGLQTKTAKRYMLCNNIGLIDTTLTDVPNFNLPEMQKIRAQWIQNQNYITEQQRKKTAIVAGTKEHFENEFQDTLNALNKQKKELEQQRIDMIISKQK